MSARTSRLASGHAHSGRAGRRVVPGDAIGAARSSGACCSRGRRWASSSPSCSRSLLVPPAGAIGRQGQLRAGVPGVPARDPRLGPPAPARGPLRPGRGADRPLDGRRHRRRVPQRHDRRLGLRALRRRNASRPAGARPARQSSGSLAVAPDPDPARGRARHSAAICPATSRTRSSSARGTSASSSRSS